MNARILFFSVLQDLTGQDEMPHPVPAEGLPVSQLLNKLYQIYPGLSHWDQKLLIAVNCEYASRDHIVKSGDEVAIMPPVQGG
jgi:molybdopterin converting factor small subunit